jgi:hypothetical protein
MPRVSAAFFTMTVIYLTIGMIWGEYMGASEDHLLFPAHAHLNLVGGVLSAIFGTFYALTQATMSPRLAWANFVISTLGIVLFIPALITILKGDLTFLPVNIAGELLSMLGILIFGVSVLRELTRARS